MRKRVVFPMLAVGLMGTFGLWATPAAAPKPLKPVAVVCFASYNELKADIDYVGKISGRPKLAQNLEGTLFSNPPLLTILGIVGIHKLIEPPYRYGMTICIQLNNELPKPDCLNSIPECFCRFLRNIAAHLRYRPKFFCAIIIHCLLGGFLCQL